MARAGYSMVFHQVTQARLASAAENEQCDDMMSKINIASKINLRGAKKTRVPHVGNAIAKLDVAAATTPSRNVGHPAGLTQEVLHAQQLRR
jgi:hypothetical protein